MPYGSPLGVRALLHDDQVDLRRTAVDAEDVVARVVASSTYPGREAWALNHLLTPASDIDALDAFGPRDGRDSMSR